mmetsp:Transcript_786/g.3568  ORF Transcript_786/g.3568 Transcript_786/m.3568 type:complete len:244 (+) Transcript_786:4485-5216(+)
MFFSLSTAAASSASLFSSCAATNASSSLFISSASCAAVCLRIPWKLRIFFPFPGSNTSSMYTTAPCTAICSTSPKFHPTTKLPLPLIPARLSGLHRTVTRSMDTRNGALNAPVGGLPILNPSTVAVAVVGVAPGRTRTASIWTSHASFARILVNTFFVTNASKRATSLPWLYFTHAASRHRTVTRTATMRSHGRPETNTATRPAKLTPRRGTNGSSMTCTSSAAARRIAAARSTESARPFGSA